MRGEKREFEAAGDTELVENIRQVMLDGVLADCQLLSHLLIAEPGDDVRNDNELPRRQPERMGVTPTAIAT